jgi:hypothetical protein
VRLLEEIAARGPTDDLAQLIQRLDELLAARDATRAERLSRRRTPDAP